MEAMAREWSDDRLDALSERVDLGFKHVDERLVQIDRRFEEVDRRFEQIDLRFDRVESEVHDLRSEMKGEFRGIRDEIGKMTVRIDSVQRTIAFGAVALTGAIIAGFGAMCALLAAAL
jgi:predicted  nucleic acid-binding Zn-ribbon protein